MSVLKKWAIYDGDVITLDTAIDYARINEADTYNRRKMTEEEFYNKIVEGLRNDCGYSDQYGFSQQDWQDGLTERGY